MTDLCDGGHLRYRTFDTAYRNRSQTAAAENDVEKSALLFSLRLIIIMLSFIRHFIRNTTRTIAVDNARKQCDHPFTVFAV